MSENIKYQIERLLNFALEKKLIKEYDIIPSRNALLDLLSLSTPYEDTASAFSSLENLNTATPILEILLDYCVEKNIINNTITERDLMSTKIMGLLMPRASETIEEFYKHNAVSPENATNYFYNLCRNSNYIQVDRIHKNLYWQTETEFGDLEITINLSRPEKSPEEILLEKNSVQSSYPKCLLCLDNVGFAGNMHHPARQNLRIIPMTLGGHIWNFQYSPYLYYNEHCIVINSKHVPMKITRNTFEVMLDFVEKYPAYFLGANAPLPIVGGSILSHDHYQGGNHVFPMEKAQPYASFEHEDFPDVKITLLNWPLSVIRISLKSNGGNKETLVNMAEYIHTEWCSYSCEEAGIFAYKDNEPHNTVTPIARINSNNFMEIDLVLRNNLTSEEYPYGIFHSKEKYHHIKKENIGLIEVMGLAVLPGRLSHELQLIEKLLTGETFFNENDPTSLEQDLTKHYSWIVSLINDYGINNSPEESQNILQRETGLIFKNVLEDCGVFKLSLQGKVLFERFMSHCNFKKQ